MKKVIQKVRQICTDSLHEIFVTRNLVLCGLMAALAVVLGLVASIEAGPYIRIGFSGIPNRIVEFLFGPVVGSFFGGALDVLKYIMKPTGPYFFGFTFNAMFAGVLYGAILYRRPVTIGRILTAEFLVKLLVNCLLNTLWISVLYGKGFMVLLPARVLKNALMLPIDSAILYFALTYVKKVVRRFDFYPVEKVAGKSGNK